MGSTSHSGEGPEENVTGNGSNGNLEEEGMDDQNGFSDQTEDFSVMENGEITQRLKQKVSASVQCPTSYELVVWLSEYFQPEAAFAIHQKAVSERNCPVMTADGRSSGVCRISLGT